MGSNCFVTYHQERLHFYPIQNVDLARLFPLRRQGSVWWLTLRMLDLISYPGIPKQFALSFEPPIPHSLQKFLQFVANVAQWINQPYTYNPFSGLLQPIPVGQYPQILL